MTNRKLFLCRPNKEQTEICELKDLQNVGLIINLGNLNELEFTIPVFVDNEYELVRNPLVEKLGNLYTVRITHDGEVEHFVYTKGSRTLNVDGKTYRYKLLSSPKLLDKKIIRNYKGESKQLSSFVIDLLEGTEWKLGYVDSTLETAVASYSVCESTALQSIFDIAEKFGALIEWDTVNREVKLTKYHSIGENKGFKVNEGKIERLMESIKSKNELITSAYKRALEAINNAIEEMQLIQNNTSYSSSEYREALTSQIVLENAKLELIRNELVNKKSIIGGSLK